MYDELSAYYHLMFESWDASIARQAAVLGPLLEQSCDGTSVQVLDAACGIGTQAIGLAFRGHQVTGSDLSAAATARARVEAVSRDLAIPFYTADVRDLSDVPGAPFGAVLMADNAMAHLLTEDDVCRAARSIAHKLQPGGVFLASMRDYDTLARERPAFHGPAFFDDGGKRRIVHQVWDWTAEHYYTMHLHITFETGAGWEYHHFTSAFHAIPRSMVTGALSKAGFSMRWLEPAESGYYQPVVLARLV